MVKEMAEESFSPHGHQEAERERRRGQDMPFKSTPPVTYFLPQGPLPNSPFMYEVIMG
jgi:hypothetical protein